MPDPYPHCSCDGGPHLSNACMKCGWQARRLPWKLVYDVDEGVVTLYGPEGSMGVGARPGRLLIFSHTSARLDVNELLWRLRESGLDVDYSSDE